MVPSVKSLDAEPMLYGRDEIVGSCRKKLSPSNGTTPQVAVMGGPVSESTTVIRPTPNPDGDISMRQEGVRAAREVLIVRAGRAERRLMVRSRQGERQASTQPSRKGVRKYSRVWYGWDSVADLEVDRTQTLPVTIRRRRVPGS